MARVAFVTGGTRGIGRAICERLKSDGMHVAAGYSGNDEAAVKALPRAETLRSNLMTQRARHAVGSQAMLFGITRARWQQREHLSLAPGRASHAGRHRHVTD